MTQLSKEEHQAMMDDMQAFDEQMPCVGIFWYDPEEKTLFGVRKHELTPRMVGVTLLLMLHSLIPNIHETLICT